MYLGSDPTQRTRALSAITDLPPAPVSATTVQKLQAPQPARSGPNCLVYWRSIGEYDAPTIIDELHTRYWSADTLMAYGQQADSTIEVAFSADGSHWSAQGSVHVSNSGSQQTGVNEYSRNFGHQMTLQFNYTKAETYDQCWGWQGSYKICADYWDGGGFSTGADTSQYDGLYYQPGSTPMQPGEYWQTTTETAVLYSAGVRLVGVGLTTQSGYSQWVSIQWTTRNDSGGYGCLYGSHSQSPSQAGIVYAGPWGASGC